MISTLASLDLCPSTRVLVETSTWDGINKRLYSHKEETVFYIHTRVFSFVCFECRGGVKYSKSLNKICPSFLH